MHPNDRRHRFLISVCHGIRRAKGEVLGIRDRDDYLEKWAARHRNTTKLCSCSMCGNPRRKAWKGKDKLTMQEKKFFESMAV